VRAPPLPSPGLHDYPAAGPFCENPFSETRTSLQLKLPGRPVGALIGQAGFEFGGGFDSQDVAQTRPSQPMTTVMSME
jgi:hypothetical protein